VPWRTNFEVRGIVPGTYAPFIVSQLGTVCQDRYFWISLSDSSRDAWARGALERRTLDCWPRTKEPHRAVVRYDSSLAS